MTVTAGLALALLSAFALNWGFLTQHGAASSLPPLSLRTPLRSLRSLFWFGRSPLKQRPEYCRVS